MPPVGGWGGRRPGDTPGGFDGVLDGDLTVTGEIYHGPKTVVIQPPPFGITSAGAPKNFTNVISSDWKSYFRMSAAGELCVLPINLQVGSRIISLAFSYFSTAGSTILELIGSTLQNANGSTQLGDTHSTTGWQTREITIATPFVVDGTKRLTAQYMGGAINDLLSCMTMIYDRPPP